MSIHVMPIPKTVALTTPGFTLGTANTAGGALTSVASNSTLLAFDASTPAAVAGTGAVGSATVAARRDHVHASVSGAITTVDNNIARYTGTSGALQGYTSGGPTVGDTGIMNMSGQPLVLVTRATDVNNVTGAGTNYTIVWDNEVFDQGSNMTTTTFTAPVGGKYLFELCVACMGLAANHTSGFLQIITTLKNQMGSLGNPGAIRSAGNEGQMLTTIVTNMDAGDEAYATIYIDGGSDVVDIDGSTSTYASYMNIMLLA